MDPKVVERVDKITSQLVEKKKASAAGGLNKFRTFVKTQKHDLNEMVPVKEPAAAAGDVLVVGADD